MSIITLISDWNSDDYYSAAVKGRILSNCPDASVIDITNKIPPFNIAMAAFQLKHSYKHFPAGTIHLIAVNSETDDDHPMIAVKANEHYFIGCDNGIFGLLLESDPDEIVVLDSKDAGTFPEWSVFAGAACKLASKGNLSELGQKYTRMNKRVPMLPAIEESMINGGVIYIDSYKNVITNISFELFQQIGKGRPYEILVQSNHYKINRLNKKYGDSSMGEMLALFNSIGLLEIAINRGNASDLLNLTLNSSIRIKFK
jgi:S-adenosylmethionine hydrolase